MVGSHACGTWSLAHQATAWMRGATQQNGRRVFRSSDRNWALYAGIWTTLQCLWSDFCFAGTSGGVNSGVLPRVGQAAP